MKNLQSAMLLSAFLVATTFSCKCKKDEQLQPQTQQAAPKNPVDYHQLKKGNYWIYATYKVDKNGKADSLLQPLDSCYVEKDTVINGNTYAKFVRPMMFFGTDTWYCRDSGSYLVDRIGNILFAYDDYSDVLQYKKLGSGAAPPDDTMALVHIKMESRDSVIVVPAGSFKTNTLSRVYYMHPPFDDHGKIRRYCFRYAWKVGIVEETIAWYQASYDVWIHKLVRYHVE